MTVVAIAGHGPSLEGAGRGGEIDACDIVIRFQPWSWQPAADYGTRTDYGLMVFRRKLWGPVVETPRIAMWMMDVGRPVDPYPGAELIDFRWATDALLALGGRCGKMPPGLSRGAAAALIAFERLNPSEVRLYGFDALKHGDCKHWDYHGAYDEDPTISPAHLRHDPAAERRLIEQRATCPVRFM